MKLYSIPTGNFKLDGGAMFGVVPKSIWQKINPSDDNNMCNWAMRCLLIEDGNKLILVDTGIGNKQDEKFFGHYYLNGQETLEKSLAAKGFSCDDITDVVLTHLHFDHCGGSIKKEKDLLVPTFKNATYWSNKNHWQWATQPNAREKASFLKENILPLAESGQLNFFENSETNNINSLETIDSNILSQLKIKFVHGHTNAMMLPQIEYKGKTLVFMADLLPSAGHIPLPYVMAYDMFPLTTLTEKKLFLDEAVANDYILFFEHDLQHECCTLQLTEKGIKPKDYFKLDSL